MKKYKIKIKAFTPIHIGTGESYEPINFVIDNGYLYEFDEIEFFNNLNDLMKKKFLSAVEKRSDDSLFEVHKIIKENKEIAKKVAFKKVQVSKTLEEEYKEKIGKVVQFEGKTKNKKVFKNFNIQKTLRLSNSPYQVYIPGSSIKGAILTAFGEYIYKKDKKLFNEMFNKCTPSQKGNVFKYVSVSDSKPLKTYSVIGYAVNKERFEDDEQGPDQQIEVIYSSEKQHSEFEFEFVLKENNCENDYKIDIEGIKKSCNEHYLPIFEQMLDGYAYFKGKEVDDFTNEYFSNNFWETYKRLKLKENEFLLRVGKFSQARAVTIDGLRKIRVKESGGGPKRKPIKWQTLDQETTSWLFGLNKSDNLMPFGWVICEILESKNLESKNLKKKL
ncbi:RAMP superfamily CRISPR-associated protein [Caminibacter pacificus]